MRYKMKCFISSCYLINTYWYGIDRTNKRLEINIG